MRSFGRFLVGGIKALLRDEAPVCYELPMDQEIGHIPIMPRNRCHSLQYLPPTPFEHVLCLGGAFGDNALSGAG